MIFCIHTTTVKRCPDMVREMRRHLSLIYGINGHTYFGAFPIERAAIGINFQDFDTVSTFSLNLLFVLLKNSVNR